MDIFSHLFVTFLPYFCILALASIALIFSERAGIVNLGINGVIVVGAAFYMIFAHVFSDGGNKEVSGWLQIPLFIISALGGMLFSLLHGFICIRLKANQIISGIALNILAPGITIAILFIFGTGNKLPFNVSELSLGNAAKYEISNVVSLKVLLTLVVIAISIFVLTFTKWGLRFKSIGENPQAADVAGINVNRMKWISIFISGALAGIAGGIYISSLSSGNQFTTGNVEGLGYLAIAIMIVGRWKIIWSVLIAILFSLLFSLGLQFKFIFPDEKDSIVSLIKMIPYLLTIVILVILSKPSMKAITKAGKALHIKWITKIGNRLLAQSNGPKAAGEPYDKSKR